jgi:hypothetical protein
MRLNATFAEHLMQDIPRYDLVTLGPQVILIDVDDEAT